jgi:hypothetical protein
VLPTLGFLAFGVGLLGLLGVINPGDDQPFVSPTTKASPFAPGGTAEPLNTPSKPVVHLSQPHQSMGVPLEGTTVSGTVDGELGTSTLWLFTFSDGFHFRTGQIVANGDGEFSLDTGQVGTSAESGKSFTFEVVQADAAATALIADMKPSDEGDHRFTTLPPGSTQLAAVDVERL